jgi:hypothetical protein
MEGYTDGFSPELAVAGSADGTKLPSDIRIGRREPPPNDPNVKAYTQLRTSEQNRRYSADVYVPGQWRVHQEKPAVPKIPDQVDEKPPIRPTQTMAPTDNLLVRPWHHPRNAADALGPGATLHFSMADHRRLYPIMLQQPRGGVGNNIFRVQPQPWDADLYIVEEPPNAQSGGLFGGNTGGSGGLWR